MLFTRVLCKKVWLCSLTCLSPGLLVLLHFFFDHCVDVSMLWRYICMYWVTQVKLKLAKKYVVKLLSGMTNFLDEGIIFWLTNWWIFFTTEWIYYLCQYKVTTIFYLKTKQDSGPVCMLMKCNFAWMKSKYLIITYFLFGLH